jgi:hypothetical protein
VTIAQRARLVVALGILNLILATIALAVGAFGPTLPSSGPNRSDTAALPSASAAAATTASPATNPSGSGPGTSGPLETGLPGGSPSPSSSPLESPPVSPSPIEPTPTPAALATPSAIPPAISSSRPTAAPTPRPTPVRTPQPTPEPTPRPTVRPTPEPTPEPTPRPTPPPTPRPSPTKHGHHPRPPCPGDRNPPPGHDRGTDNGRPCSSDGPHGGPKSPRSDRDSRPESGGKDHAEELIVVLPLLAGAAAWTAVRRRAHERGVRRRASSRD